MKIFKNLEKLKTAMVICGKKGGCEGVNSHLMGRKQAVVVWWGWGVIGFEMCRPKGSQARQALPGWQAGGRGNRMSGLVFWIPDFLKS